MEITFDQQINKKIGSAQTENAYYAIEAQIQNGVVTSVTANVRAEERTTGADGIVNIGTKMKGNISYINGKVSCAGFSLDGNLPIYLAEFAEIVDKVKGIE